MILGVYDNLSAAKSVANILLNQSIISRNSRGNFWLWNGLEHLHWEKHDVCHYYTSYRLWEEGCRFDQERFRIIPTKVNNFFFHWGLDAKTLLIRMCISLQSLRLPTLILLAIFDQYIEIMELIPMYKKWEIIKLIRHSKEPGGVLNYFEPTHYSYVPSN